MYSLAGDNWDDYLAQEKITNKILISTVCNLNREQQARSLVKTSSFLGFCCYVFK